FVLSLSKDERCGSCFDKLTTSGCIAVLTMVAAIASGCSRPSRLAADLVITGANIWTGNPLQRDARAVAIVGDRIVDVGGAEEIDRWRGTEHDRDHRRRP